MPASTETDFRSVLDRLASGAVPTPADINGFADLSREAAGMLAERWPTLPVPVRATLLAHVLTRSEESVEQDFTAVAQVALDDATPELRRLAANALWEAEDRTTGRKLLRALQTDPDDGVRAICCRHLGAWVLRRELGSADEAFADAVIDELRRVAESGSTATEARANAIVALAPRSLPWVETLIREAYYDDDSTIRLASVRAMGFSSQPKWLEYVYEQLQSDDPDFRKAAAEAAGEIMDEDAVDPLGDALDDEDVAVVRAALDALAEIGGELATEYLESYRRRAPAELVGTVDDIIRVAREAPFSEEEEW